MTRTRSIGARSDWSGKTGAETDGDDDGDTDGVPTNGMPTPSRTWSIYKDDDPNSGKPRPEDDPDDPINKYVQDQLDRIKTNESHEFAEELAAQNDGANDEL
jgi:hypothetical protein